MRISLDMQNNLKQAILTFLPNARVFLFGSRVDDTKKGGDIDILILADRKLNWKEKGKIEQCFFQQFGEQKLDLVSFQSDDNNPFKDLVLMNSIEL